jgi:putative transposase
VITSGGQALGANVSDDDGSDARWLKALEDVKAKLKKLLAEAMLDNAILKDVASRRW